MSWHWHGSLTRAVAVLASQIGYGVTVPTPTSQDPLIAIDLDDVTAGDLLDEVAAAGREAADVTIDIEAHTIRIAWHA